MQLKTLCIALLGLQLISLNVSAVTLYQGEDNEGNPTFSDQPFPDSTPINVKPVQTFEAPPTPATPTSTPQTDPKAIDYSVGIVSPTNEQTFGFDVETITVSLEITPALNSDDAIQIKLNDQTLGPYNSNMITLPRLDRGAYTLQADIVAAEAPETIKASSSAVTFYQQRPTVK